MRHITRLLIAVAAAVFLALGAASPSLATTTPLPKIQTNGFNNWHTSSWRVRPHTVVFGNLFEIVRLYYRHYNHTDAYGHGRLWLSTCRPDCSRGGYHVHASAYFWGPRHHAGIGEYFGHLRLRWHHDGRSHSMLLWINKRGQWWWRALNG